MGAPTSSEGFQVFLESASPVMINNLAWQLAVNPEYANGSPAFTVEIASKAVERTPTEGEYWNTLGAAQYRACNWKAAIEALEKSMGLRKGGDSFDWFFLGMAYWKLGNKEQGRLWYDKALEWMDKNRPYNGELKHIRAEAAELLGIKEQRITGKDAKDTKTANPPVCAGLRPRTRTDRRSPHTQGDLRPAVAARSRDLRRARILRDCLPTAKQLHNLAQGRGTPRTLGTGAKKKQLPRKGCTTKVANCATLQGWMIGGSPCPQGAEYRDPGLGCETLSALEGEASCARVSDPALGLTAGLHEPEETFGQR